MRKFVPALFILVGAAACDDRGNGTAGVPPGAGMPAPPTSSYGNLPPGVPLTDLGAIPAHAAPLAPVLQGRDEDGNTFDLAELRGKRVILVFYRTAACGLCVQQLRGLASAADAFDQLGAEIVALTSDPPEANRRTAELLELDFPVVSIDRNTMAAWGIWPDGAARPHPASYIVDQDGRLRYIQIGRTEADRATNVTLVFNLRALDNAVSGDDAT